MYLKVSVIYVKELSNVPIVSKVKAKADYERGAVTFK